MDGVSVISAMHGDGRAIDQAAMLAAMLLLPTRAPYRGERAAGGPAVWRLTTGAVL